MRGAIPPFNLEEWLQGLRIFSAETDETAYVVYNGTINNVANPVFLFNGTEKTVSVCVPTSLQGILAVDETGVYTAASAPGTTWDAPLIEAAGLTGFSSAGNTPIDISTGMITGRLDPV